ncbi:alpha/beta hydrolase [Sphingomonas naphthae]|uniref:Proline iminopeptidase n=1 Tax=Sphingomonas naphthae TaxID=1813468 RepID=A0ABY7TQE0_9SPHN|nr:alpha/beta hydrolase [Sphingomonas naphthae]WCT75165.1 alpha/beta hydrolase [Sphingomonas naphthae]
MPGRLLLAFALALIAAAAPARPPADRYAPARAIVADIGRIVTPNGVQETFEATLGGARQVVNVRGADRANPILLFVHGGPGAVEMPVAWAFQRPWEDHFTIVQWDQRGAGRSFPLNDPKALAPTLTVDRYRDDAIELIELLRRKYGQRRVFLMGHSWGSIVGLSVAAKRPDLLHAYIGVGQIIDFRENERQGFDWTLAQARKAGNAKAVAELEAIRPYPGPGAFSIDKMTTERTWSVHYGALAAYRDNADFYFRAPRLSPEYTPADVTAWDEGSKFTINVLFPKLADISFVPLTKLDVPVFLFLGRQDYTTPSGIAAAWLNRVKAPRKGAIWFEHSAHLPMIEEPGRVLVALVEQVRPLAGKVPR